MNANGVTATDIVSWVEKSLEKENLEDYEVILTGKSEKGDGYLGEIVYANVTATTKGNGKKSLNFVIKHGKSNEHLRKVTPVKEAFQTEIHFYDKVFPIFRTLQLDKNIRNVFNPLPKCYKTITMDNMEVVILEDLKTRGYRLYDRLKTLNFYHLKTILREYGRLHALSFALRDQKREEFKLLTTNRPDVMKQFLNDKSIRENFQKIADNVANLLQENSEFLLLEKFRNLINQDPFNLAADLLEREEPQSVIVHGDCWTNNFLFQYENDDQTSPSKVALLDWQMSALRSPVMDLSYLVYATGSKLELDRFEELMEIYYNSLSSFLEELGSDPEKLFSYADLKIHWKKYSISGFVNALTVLKLQLSSKESTPSFEDLQEGENLGDILDVNVVEKDLYYERMRDIVNHCCNNTF